MASYCERKTVNLFFLLTLWLQKQSFILYWKHLHQACLRIYYEVKWRAKSDSGSHVDGPNTDMNKYPFTTMLYTLLDMLLWCPPMQTFTSLHYTCFSFSIWSVTASECMTSLDLGWIDATLSQTNNSANALIWVLTDAEKPCKNASFSNIIIYLAPSRWFTVNLLTY